MLYLYNIHYFFYVSESTKLMIIYMYVYNWYICTTHWANFNIPLVRILFGGFTLISLIDLYHISKLGNSKITKCTPEIDIPTIFTLAFNKIVKKIFDQKDCEFITTLIWYDGWLSLGHTTVHVTFTYWVHNEGQHSQKT